MLPAHTSTLFVLPGSELVPARHLVYMPISTSLLLVLHALWGVIQTGLMTRRHTALASSPEDCSQATLDCTTYGGQGKGVT